MASAMVARHAVTATAVNAAARVATVRATVADTRAHNPHARPRVNPISRVTNAPTVALAMTTMTVTNVSPAPTPTWAACASVNPGSNHPMAASQTRCAPASIHSADAAATATVVVAAVDGAGRWQRFRHVTWPLLLPALVPAVINGVVWTFNMFNVIYLVSGGAPDGGTDILVTEAFRFAFERDRYGLAAAYSTLVFGILLLFTLATNRFTKATKGALE